MIVCGHSTVEFVDGEWKVGIDKKVGNVLDFFPGQILFGASEEGSKRLFLSSLRLNPHVSYFRIFLEDVRGSLATMTKLFSERGINILSGGAFGFGNIWVSEFIADFTDVDATPEALVGEIEGLGGFVTSREITELFPRAFALQSTYEVKSDSPDEMYILLPSLPKGMTGEATIHAVFKAWARVQTLFVDFFSSESKLMKISATIQDVPGSLNKLAELLGSQVNLIAIDEHHHDETSGKWSIYGMLKIGGVDELCEKARKMPNILRFDVESLGWGG